MSRVLRVRKGAPEKQPPSHSIWHIKCDEQTCISPSLWDLQRDPSWHGKYRCLHKGTIKTDKGMLCGMHAKVWARRGYINADHLREILKVLAEENAKKAAARVKCLRAGDCL